MRWLLSLTLGLFIAWIIVYQVNKMQRVSYFNKADVVAPGPLNEIDQSLVAVGLAQYPQVPSIMDSVNKPVKYDRNSPAPAPKVISGSLPDPNFTPNPAIAAFGPSPSTPLSSTMSSVSSPKGFSMPSPAPGPGPAPPTSTPTPATIATPTMTTYGMAAPAPISTPSPASGPAPSPYGFSSGSPFPSIATPTMTTYGMAAPAPISTPSPASGPAPSPYGFSSGSPFPSS